MYNRPFSLLLNIKLVSSSRSVRGICAEETTGELVHMEN